MNPFAPRVLTVSIALAASAAHAAGPAATPDAADPDPGRPTMHVQPPALDPALRSKRAPSPPRAVNGVTVVDVLFASGYDDVGGDRGNEPALAVNPLDPRQIVLTSFAGSNWWNGGNSALFYSGDGGATWTYSLSIPPPTGVVSPYACPCDQTVDWGRDGRLYATFLHYASDGTTAMVYSAQTTAPTSASSWVYPVNGGVAETTNLSWLLNPDQPWVASGPAPADVTKTGVGVAYDNFDATYTVVEARAAGSPGLDPIDFTRDAATHGDGQRYNDGMNAGNRLAVGPDGKIFDVFQRLVGVLGGGVKQLTYLVSVSTDGGLTFGAANSDHASGAKSIAVNAYSFQGNGSKVGGVNALLGGVDAIAVDSATGTAWIVYGVRSTTIANDRLYLVPVTYSAGSLVVGTARPVTDSTVKSYLPAVAVLPNGEVGVLFLSLSGTTFTWNLIQTADGGATIAKSTTLATFTSPFADNGASNQRIFGDYVQLRAAGCSFYGAFPARGAGPNSVNSIDPYFVSATAATACTTPSLTALAPSSACAGGPAIDVALQGSGFASGAAGRWAGSMRSTSVATPVSATMSLSAADVASPGIRAVDLLGPVPAGILTGSLPFSVDAPAGSPGATLAAARAGGDVQLDWAAAPGAAHYDVLRCASTSGACAPSPIASPIANAYADPVAGDADSYWYLVQAVNACGATP